MINRIPLPKSSTFFVDQNCHFSQWQQAVNFHKQLLEQNDATDWLLYCEDSYQFSVLFFALMSANKKVILPQNGTVNQLAECMTTADGFATQALDDSQADVFFNAELPHTETCDKPFRFHPDAHLSLTAPLSINPTCEIVLFTSGSSGKAKSINKQFSHLLAEVEALEQCFGQFVRDATIVSTVSHQHIYGLLFKLLWPIWCSHDVVLQAFQFPEHLCNTAENLALDMLALVSSPAHLHRLVKDNIYQTKDVKFTGIFSSGGPLDASASQLIEQQLEQQVVEVFGSTETGGIAWRQRSKESNEAWQPFDNIIIQQSPYTKCLQIKSPYFDHNGWYETEDKISVNEVGQFDLQGRVDRIVKIEEKRVSLDQVQQCLKNLSFVEDAYCLAFQSKRGKQVVATVVLTEAAKVELSKSRNLIFNQKIIAALNADLESIAIPKKFRYLSGLPYNSSGKLSKAEMEKFFE